MEPSQFKFMDNNLTIILSKSIFRSTAVVLMVLATVSLVLNIVTFNIIGAVIAGIMIILPFVLYKGVVQENANLVLIWLICEGIILIINFISIVFLIIGLAGSTAILESDLVLLWCLLALNVVLTGEIINKKVLYVQMSMLFL